MSPPSGPEEEEVEEEEEREEGGEEEEVEEEEEEEEAEEAGEEEKEKEEEEVVVVEEEEQVEEGEEEKEEGTTSHCPRAAEGAHFSAGTKVDSPSFTTQTVLLRRGLSVAEPAPGTTALPWLDWGVLAWLDGGLSGLGSLCGGEEASEEDGLGGEAGGGERVARLRRGSGVGGNPERQMSVTQH